MQRYKLTIEYNGASYVGWQKQLGQGQKTVQGVLEEAMYRLSQEKATIYGAGRTDSGVHALAQIAHCDLEKIFSVMNVWNGLNAWLSQARERVSILLVEEVDSDFHARFSAMRRHYLYRILNRRSPPALDRGLCWWFPHHVLDVEKMQEAANVLVGCHDFTTFRSVHCQAKSAVRTLEKLDITQNAEWIEIRASARSFLHRQIRSFVGSLVKVGWGAWRVLDLKLALDARNRAFCGMLAPACGLYFVGVDYPESGK
ncbi:MAG: tRNA pseudouridine38-40 synthase [Candidatus Tokpelaia sp. JSC161]|jgi:tRNA pseudouridine38-40 synthase|nr:MAG: tRNA pseudouridine38-40 synthase [Candidatus Tokpelaia sp. JSC161]